MKVLLQPRPERLSFGLFSVLLLGAILSYVEEETAYTWSGYLLALLALFGLLVVWPIVSRARIVLVVTGGLIALLITVISMGMSPYDRGFLVIVQSLAYPIVGIAVLIAGWRIRMSRPHTLAICLATAGLVNMLVALLASLGIVSQLPLLGQVEIGRVIFGTSISSSSGLLFNVNYYATTQATIFLLYGWLISMRPRKPNVTEIVTGLLLAVSTIIGSSRGATGGLLAALLVLAILHSFSMGTKKVLAVTLIGFCLLPLLTMTVLAYQDWIYAAFRFGKGLNLRDLVWGAAFELWSERPLIGWGFADAVSERMGSMVGREGSLQSSYLQTLIRGGVLLFVVTYGMVIAIILFGLRFNRRRWIESKWPLAIVTFWLISSLVRTYSFGGLGFVPLVAGIALSALLYAIWVENHGMRRYRMRLVD